MNLTDEWLSALALVKSAIPDVNMKRLFGRTTVELEASMHLATRCVLRGLTEGTRDSLLRVGDKIETYYKVERIEILLYAACRSLAWLEYGERSDYGPALIRLARLTGCVPVNYGPPDQRWRLLALYQRPQDTPVALAYEDRPLCGICDIPVPTGHTQRTIHDGCLAYAFQAKYPDPRQRLEAAKRYASRAQSNVNE